MQRFLLVCEQDSLLTVTDNSSDRSQLAHACAKVTGKHPPSRARFFEQQCGKHTCFKRSCVYNQSNSCRGRADTQHSRLCRSARHTPTSNRIPPAGCGMGSCPGQLERITTSHGMASSRHDDFLLTILQAAEANMSLGNVTSSRINDRYYRQAMAYLREASQIPGYCLPAHLAQ
jgi:hypothetical protein